MKSKKWLEIHESEYRRIQAALMKLNIYELEEHNKLATEEGHLEKRFSRNDMNALFGIKV